MTYRGSPHGMHSDVIAILAVSSAIVGHTPAQFGDNLYWFEWRFYVSGREHIAAVV